jgi:SAM-dependent methyltransferase
MPPPESTPSRPSCRACGSQLLITFHRQESVPAHSVLLLYDQRAARDYPRGDIELAFCERCGYIGNLAFDSALLEYGAGYEGTQAFSPTFSAFHRRLAQRLVEAYDLRHKHVLEIGCGHGEFLDLLCAVGDNRGTGYDPSAENTAPSSRVAIVRELFPSSRPCEEIDAVVCNMTLEHIFDPGGLISAVRDALADDPGGLVFLQVPEAERIVREVAFWDIYYEHCSYFTIETLSSLLERHGLRVEDHWTDYDDQYLMIVARPAVGIAPRRSAPSPALRSAIDTFPARLADRMSHWRHSFRALADSAAPAALWGAGSKAVAFLSAVRPKEAPVVVDINPRKWGTFLPGSGYPVRRPDDLRELAPEVVIVMNPIYRDEVESDLAAMNLSPRILTP